MNVRDERLVIALNGAEINAIETAAKESGLNKSTWCRLVLRYAAGCGELAEQLKRAKRAAPWAHREA